jgi:precorrin-6A/cobalt-precorrin-6A reductase
MIFNHGRSAITPNLLILGGTTEATALCQILVKTEVTATLSLAGRVDRPKRHPLPMRVGGFGGAIGLMDHLRAKCVTHVIDATHPFAQQMSNNACEACSALRVPLVALVRPQWRPVAGDRWQCVPDIAGAVAALDRPALRVFLAVGRMHLQDFAPNPQHHYLLRLVDPPKSTLPFPDAQTTVDRGPFSVDGDLQLMREHGTEIVVSKNSGGTGAEAKIIAARTLGVPVIMINRPEMPARAEVDTVEEVLTWLAGHGAVLGV